MLERMVHCVIRAVLRVTGITGIELGDVGRGRYPPRDKRPNVPAQTKALEDLFSIARETYELEERRRESLLGKVTVLLAVVAGLAALVPAAMVPGPKGWGTAVAGLCFVVSVLLVVHFLGVRKHSAPRIDAATIGADGPDRKRALIADYLQAASYNAGTTDYLVDVFRAALRVFVVGVIVGLLSAVLVGESVHSEEGAATASGGRPSGSGMVAPAPPAVSSGAAQVALSRSHDLQMRVSELEGELARARAQIGSREALMAQVSTLETALTDARMEARRNLVKGALVLEFEGRAPGEVLKPMLDFEPAKGTVRFSSNPNQIAGMAWTYLQTVVPEDFEEALQRCLDHDLLWTERCDLRQEELQMVRLYTEQAYRLMVEIQQRATTMRRRLSDSGALPPEERERIERILGGVNDHGVYVRSYAPSFVLPKLFPKEAESK